jgi:hypothetical protein
MDSVQGEGLQTLLSILAIKSMTNRVIQIL